MNKRWNKLCVSALACMALVVPLTACEGQLPTPAADTSTKVAPDLTEAQEKSWTFASARPRSISVAAVCPNMRPFPRTSPSR